MKLQIYEVNSWHLNIVDLQGTIVETFNQNTCGTRHPDGSWTGVSARQLRAMAEKRLKELCFSEADDKHDRGLE